MPFRSLARTLAHRSWFARLGRVLVPADRFVARATRGRVVALGLVPSLLLTTTGRRSGRRRSTPLLAIPDGNAFLVVGSNWGGPRHPAWALNLRAQPQASVMRNGEAFPVRAQLLAGAERERAWRLMLQHWPAYRTYAQRAGGRELHLFRLQRSG